MSYEHLLSPITIKNVELRNRMVVPSMGSNLGNDDGSVSQRLIDYYRTRAAGGWGLVVVEGVVPITSARITQFYDDGIDYEQDGQQLSARGFDNVILAMGTRAYNPLEDAARAVCGEVYVVGDASHAGPANKATEEGLAAGLAV